MASSKEMQQPTSRPFAHRPSMSITSAAGSLGGARQSHSRTNSHSVLSSSLNANHRVTRRKSMTNTGANVAAVAAALTEAGDRAMPLPIAIGSRRNTMSKHGMAARSAIAAGLPSPPASLPSHKFAMAVGADGGIASSLNIQESAIDDGDRSGDERAEKAFQKARMRRASDGQPLAKEGRKSNRPELRCDQCGKGYKHSSCLTKHLWEHTPEWSVTSKLLISKHQQVQLLEAASVLVAMNVDAKEATTPPDSTKDFASEQGSTSPAASGFSDAGQDRSSADTTPPPVLEPGMVRPYRSMSKRLSTSSGFGRSYQSAPLTPGSFNGSTPVGSGFGTHIRQGSQDQIRPTSSGKNATGKDDRDLAAAVELLSCSLGSTNGSSMAVHLSPDVPPVPPLPAQYLDQAALSGTSFFNSFPSRAPESFTRGAPTGFRRGIVPDDVKMEESGDSAMDDDDDDRMSRARSDEDDDGVFGRMEE